MYIDDVTISQSSLDSLTIKMSMLERRIYFLALCVGVFGVLAKSHLVPEDGTSCSNLQKLVREQANQLQQQDNHIKHQDNQLREQTRIIMGLDDTMKLKDDENTKLRTQLEAQARQLEDMEAAMASMKTTMDRTDNEDFLPPQDCSDVLRQNPTARTG